MTKSKEFPLPHTYTLKAEVFIHAIYRYLFSVYLSDKFGSNAMGYNEFQYTMFASLESLLVYYVIEYISVTSM